MDLRAWGIDEGFHDTGGRWHPAPPDAVDAVASAMDAGADGPPPSPLWIVRAGERHHLPGPAEIVTEDGRVIPVDGGLPADLPLGYHELHGSGQSLPLVVAPWRCYRPATLRVWGWAIQLYAVRSAQSWGMGDLTDLRDLARWSARDVGAGVVLLNPLSAARPGVPQQPSPYFPSSRRFRNPLYLRVEEIPGAGALGLELDRIASAGRALNASRPIDRDEILGLKILALEQLYAGFSGDPRFDEFCADHGDALTVFATFNTLVEEHGQAWRAWPVEHRHPARREVGELAEARADRVRFHRWLQWQLDRQLGAASDEIALMHDLPVGIDPDGADAWQWQDVIAADARMGAPPDDFNERGQDWGLAPFDPWKLRRASYRPFIETIRAGFRHAGALRLDHVMGLFRLFWIPAGHGPADGVYVRYPADDLLDLLALESARAGA
jgi:4-alpha-glucanotransferase